jgi:hypothetical protein
MPPAATVAAGIAARQTAFYANQIGRICAAIAPNATKVTQVPAVVGAGLIECSFALFIAGVQVRDVPHQCLFRILLMPSLRSIKTMHSVPGLYKDAQTSND